MKKLLLLSLILSACTTQKQPSPEELHEQAIKDISAPLIARDFVTLDNYLDKAKDTTLSEEKRGYSLGDAQVNFTGYMNRVSLENINTPEGQKWINKQKELITDKYRAYAESVLKEQAIEAAIKNGK